MKLLFWIELGVGVGVGVGVRVAKAGMVVVDVLGQGGVRVRS